MVWLDFVNAKLLAPSGKHRAVLALPFVPLLGKGTATTDVSRVAVHSVSVVCYALL